MSKDPVVIVSAARTPMGGMMGDLSSLSGPELGGIAIKAAVERAKIKPELIQEVIMGCILPAGTRQAPARQAALNAGLAMSATCTTINKACGSGMKAAMFANDLLSVGTNDVMVAGGMESMSNAPYLVLKGRGGYRLGHSQLIDHMFYDALEDAYFPETKGRLMGTFAEDCAKMYEFTREEQDNFAITSTTRAQKAIEDGSFDWEVVPVAVSSRKGEILVKQDEQPPKAKLDKISSLKPAFSKDGTVTAANSSSISDGAAALVMMRRSVAEKLGLKPLATVVSHASNSMEPRYFPIAPIGATKALLEKTGWSTNDVDLWEINEAFAVVTMAAMRDLKLDHEKVNIHGGACALGHPVGASGARIITTLLGALRKTGGKRGVAAICIGGGEATAIAVEME
ncbi:acetyl-CoA C-acyltransferase [Microvirga sp. W0021]|uniref:Acetyl-CoA C-acyltransferase n=1 Tax=Hohaiivirga grylli TaxID=3133970 RepID=A0ABV0BL07_9HYPH